MPGNSGNILKNSEKSFKKIQMKIKNLEKIIKKFQGKFLK